ncbi:hypothetical protein KW786_02065 [Candidatus Parcubacteria bacterium]|nr:hypothetical protein [Candidatus Parcubacteria bacterium]
MTLNTILFLVVGALVILLIIFYPFRKMFFNAKNTKHLIIDLETAMKRGVISEEEFLMICAKRSEDKLQDFLEKKSNKKSKRK